MTWKEKPKKTKCSLCPFSDLSLSYHEELSSSESSERKYSRLTPSVAGNLESCSLFLVLAFWSFLVSSFRLLCSFLPGLSEKIHLIGTLKHFRSKNLFKNICTQHNCFWDIFAVAFSKINCKYKLGVSIFRVIWKLLACMYSKLYSPKPKHWCEWKMNVELNTKRKYFCIVLCVISNLVER